MKVISANASVNTGTVPLRVIELQRTLIDTDGFFVALLHAKSILPF